MSVKGLSREKLKENRSKMYDQYLSRLSNGGETKVDIMTDLAKKFKYKNHTVVQSIINRIEGKI
ncbi:hypothetical protein KRE40_03510 [Elizabethkingia meningoseptica]|uniref:hypothetical protein n=1 Tax=Elizabethkingia TaxID=308865 RepID=UPI0023B1B79C|nr:MULTISPECIES: hypothetical protein [Elizabethkingia]MDE5507718.1 hypothetical protein [Elizabethkingia meningoseptica]MDV3594258.1 hypothetical protein [Elizabethkingia anophelis]MDV3768161.1 hypothetical protein [Elizabethkingia anophelis]GJN60499.1 hypothetical protein ELAK_06490 [Elizabethkingia anophelis]